MTKMNPLTFKYIENFLCVRNKTQYRINVSRQKV